jgi:hypothetical protein
MTTIVALLYSERIGQLAKAQNDNVCSSHQATLECPVPQILQYQDVISKFSLSFDRDISFEDLKNTEI